MTRPIASAVKFVGLSVLLLLSFAVRNLEAAEYATSESGRRVLLRDDGTWVAAGSPPVAQQQGSDRGTEEQTLQAKCRSEWGDDFRMRAYCEKQQRESLQTLSMGSPPDIPQDQFISVRRRCTGEWPGDYRMQAYCEKQQFGAIRELRKR